VFGWMGNRFVTKGKRIEIVNEEVKEECEREARANMKRMGARLLP